MADTQTKQVEVSADGGCGCVDCMAKALVELTQELHIVALPDGEEPSAERIFACLMHAAILALPPQQRKPDILAQYAVMSLFSRIAKDGEAA